MHHHASMIGMIAKSCQDEEIEVGHKQGFPRIVSISLDQDRPAPTITNPGDGGRLLSKFAAETTRCWE